MYNIQNAEGKNYKHCSVDSLQIPLDVLIRYLIYGNEILMNTNNMNNDYRIATGSATQCGRRMSKSEVHPEAAGVITLAVS